MVFGSVMFCQRSRTVHVEAPVHVDIADSQPRGVCMLSTAASTRFQSSSPMRRGGEIGGPSD